MCHISACLVYLSVLIYPASQHVCLYLCICMYVSMYVCVCPVLSGDCPTARLSLQSSSMTSRPVTTARPASVGSTATTVKSRWTTQVGTNRGRGRPKTPRSVPVDVALVGGPHTKQPPTSPRRTSQDDSSSSRTTTSVSHRSVGSVNELFVCGLGEGILMQCFV